MPERFSFNIQQLTNNDDQYWRVDWFGYLQYFDQRGRRRSEPLVDVFLSPFKKRPNSESLVYKTSTILEQTKVVKVPISYLRILRLGDVWHRGKRFFLRHSEEMLDEFHLEINNRTTEILPVSAKYEENIHILSFSHHPYHGRATQTFCEVVQLDTGDFLAVPSYVILQAYFSSSQYLFQQLFKFGLLFDSIFDSSMSTIDSDGNAFVLLRKWTHDIAAAEVARIAFDQHAKSSITNLSQNFALQLNNKEDIRPKVKFPFTGTTALRVYGKWCPLDFYKKRTDKKTFIVYDILNCTAAYPFTHLKFFRDNPGDKSSNEKDTKGEKADKPSFTKPRPNTTRNNIDVNPHDEPNNNIEELELEGRRGTEFSDLLNKDIQKERQKDHQEQDSPQIGSGAEDVTSGNTGDGDSNGAVVPVDFKLPESYYKNKYFFWQKISRLELFKDLIQLMSESSFVKHIEFIQVWPELGESQEEYSYFPVTYTASGRASTWQYINYIKGIGLTKGEEYRHRRALIAKVNLSSGAEVYLIETERRIYQTDKGWVELDSSSLFLAIGIDRNSISDYQFTQLLEDCSDNRGTWHDWMISDRTKCFSIKHASNSSIKNGEYIQRQIAIIEKYIGLKLLA